MLTSWKKSANARSTAACRSWSSAATASPSWSREPPRAGIAGERANPLLVVEQLLALLLDEHAAEQVAEQADVGTQGGVGGHALHPREMRNPPRRAGFGWSRGGSNP